MKLLTFYFLLFTLIVHLLAGASNRTLFHGDSPLIKFQSLGITCVNKLPSALLQPMSLPFIIIKNINHEEKKKHEVSATSVSSVVKGN